MTPYFASYLCLLSPFSSFFFVPCPRRCVGHRPNLSIAANVHRYGLRAIINNVTSIYNLNHNRRAMTESPAFYHHLYMKHGSSCAILFAWKCKEQDNDFLFQACSISVARCHEGVGRKMLQLPMPALACMVMDLMMV